MENKKKKDVSKILLIILLICTILCLILGGSLYFVGIRKILPVVLIFGLSFLSALIVFFLSKETLKMRNYKNLMREHVK